MIKLGIIGDPIAHSLSPALHRFMLNSLGVAGEYRAYRVRESELQDFLVAHRELVGFNVTIPHKEGILRYLDRLSPEAQRIGAVNTVKDERGALVGYNTDGLGFLRSLHGRTPTRAILVGAGGAARAVAHTLLLRSEVTALFLYNRSGERALHLAEELQQHYPNKTISVVRDPHVLPWDRVDLMVNATPVGMLKEDVLPVPLPERLLKNVLVYDLVYSPAKTKLRIEAERRGAATMGGLDMLIYQAIEALKIWLERPDLDAQLKYDSLRRFLEEQL
jgi:shikimate dehydrogenase